MLPITSLGHRRLIQIKIKVGRTVTTGASRIVGYHRTHNFGNEGENFYTAKIKLLSRAKLGF